jgi:hypothetical protein
MLDILVCEPLTMGTLCQAHAFAQRSIVRFAVFCIKRVYRVSTFYADWHWTVRYDTSKDGAFRTDRECTFAYAPLVEQQRGYQIQVQWKGVGARTKTLNDPHLRQSDRVYHCPSTHLSPASA